MQVWNILHAARCKYRTQKSRQKSSSGHHRTTSSGYIFATKACIDNRKNLLSSNTSSTCPHNMVNFGQLAGEIGSLVWGTPKNFNGFRVLAASLHGTLVVGVSQTLWRWTEGSTYIWQGGQHVGHLPTFLVHSVIHSMNQISNIPAYSVVSGLYVGDKVKRGCRVLRFGKMDQDATWYGGRPQPRPYCVRWGPSFTRKGHSSPLFSAHVDCGHTVTYLSYCWALVVKITERVVGLHRWC